MDGNFLNDIFDGIKLIFFIMLGIIFILIVVIIALVVWGL